MQTGLQLSGILLTTPPIHPPPALAPGLPRMPWGPCLSLVAFLSPLPSPQSLRAVTGWIKAGSGFEFRLTFPQASFILLGLSVLICKVGTLTGP